MARRFAKPAKIYLNGVVIANASDTNTSFDNGDNEIYTNLDGLAGFSDGASSAEVSFENAIPESGLEQQWDEIILQHRDVRVGVRIGTAQYTFEGRFRQGSIKSSVNSPSGMNVSFKGKFISKITVPAGT